MRCSRSGTTEGSIDTTLPCDRCNRHNRPCKVAPSRPSGRKPGSLGRYRGVEKALRKIQTELRKTKKTATSDQDTLQELLDLTDGKEEVLSLLLPGMNNKTPAAGPNRASEEPALESTMPSLGPTFQTESRPRAMSILQCPGDHHSPCQNTEPVSNPLGLVADACGEAQALDQQSSAALSSPVSNSESISLLATSPREVGSRGLACQLLRRPGYVSLGLKLDRRNLEHGLNALLSHEGQICRYSDYFKPSEGSQGRDTGPDLDPVDLGLLSMEEAHYLFPM